MTRKTFQTECWSVSIPKGWSVKEDSECVTFTRVEPVGAVQVSAHRKSGVVTDRDVRQFIERKRTIRKIRVGEFTGYTTNYPDQGIFWREWWLRAGTTLIYITYNVALEHKDLEQYEVDGVVDSLRLRS